jgi:thiol-disulfide isomerase/thioredoxin
VKRWWVAAGTLVILIGAVAVWLVTRDAGGRPAAVVSPFDPCPSPASPPPVSPPPPSGDPTAIALPRVVLPCFTEGEPVELATMGRPMVVNLWASWCEPCRTELPELQAFADRHPDQIAVIGVVTEDTRAASASLAEDLNVTFPALYDSGGMLRRALGSGALPITLFVDAAGHVRHTAATGKLTASTVETLAREHLGLGS